MLSHPHKWHIVDRILLVLCFTFFLLLLKNKKADRDMNYAPTEICSLNL